ncbi:MAG: M48 family metallopeptidase [Halocynthiibacter sp.]
MAFWTSSSRRVPDTPQDIQLAGDPDICVGLKRSARAKRLSLRISHADGQVSLTLPKRATLKEARAFVLEKENWIRGHLAQRPDIPRLEIGGTLLFEGTEKPILAGSHRTARYRDGAFYVNDSAMDAGPRLRAYLKVIARERLSQASDRYADMIGKPYGKITLRDTKSRWGSCTSDGNLMYSWRLVMAPPEVLDYVAAHEVAHLLEMNHSDRFWAHVDRLCPAQKTARSWLKTHGARLHQVKFD